MKIRTNIYLLLLLFAFVNSVTLLYAQNVTSIREQYKTVRETINKQKQEVHMQNNAVLTLNHNVPGIGPQKITYELFFTPCRFNSEGKMVAHELQLVQSSYNIAARSFYEEFLFDKLGEPVFIFIREQTENNTFVENRFYYSNHSLLKLLITKVEEGKRSVVYEGSDLSKYKSHQNVLKKAISLQKMFHSINGNVISE